MTMNKYRYTLAAALMLSASFVTISAQEPEDGKKITLTGSVQSDVLIPQEDVVDEQGNVLSDDPVMTNTYVELHAHSRYVDAGARLEFTQYPLPGFEKDFKGWGVPFYYVTGKYKWAELTAGCYYEQFGSGLILRTYEERSLGVDGALRGGRLALKPYKGVNLKLIAGQQRNYWGNDNFFGGYNESFVYGGDLELNIDRWSKRMQESGTYFTLGLSAVGKHEGNPETPILSMRPTGGKNPDGTPEIGSYSLNVPNKVAAFDVRASLQKGNYNFLAEYAWKSQDPSADNAYTYHRGNALLLSGSYSKRGMSVLLQAKRSQNMGYRSARAINGASSYLNHLPAFSMQHTYTLAALYPYATQYGRCSSNQALQVPGEWAFQAEVGYNFKRKTPLGGKYGTNFKVNFSHIRSIDFKPVTDGDVVGTNGWTTQVFQSGNGFGQFFGAGGETFYQDVNVQMEKKITKDWKLNLMYMHQRYNKSIVEGEGGTIKSHIAIAEAKWNINKKLTLRGEAQYLHTKQDEGDWCFGLLELSVLPSLMFTVSDLWNCGETNTHYYMAQATFTHKAHRLQLGYGRTRAGYNCTGGVCRFVPESKGVTLSYNFNF